MLGDRIKQIRENRKMGLNETAELAGISGSYLSTIENSIKKNPSMKTLEKIASALGVTVDELIKSEPISKEQLEELDKTIDVESLSKETKLIEDMEDKIRHAETILDFGTAEDALKFILTQPSLMAFGGYDLKQMSDEQIIEIANDMLFAMKLSLEKIKKKNR